jgi:hypothetical protein
MECSTIISHWKGPIVVLSTPTVVKIVEIIPWIHHSQVKLAFLEWECIPHPVYHTRSPSTDVEGPSTGVGPFPNRTLLPRRPQTMWHQPCSRHSGSWLVYTQWKLQESPISPLRINLFCVFSLLILVCSLPGTPRLWTVTHVWTLPKQGISVTKTLGFHTYDSCAGTIIGS